MTAFWQRTWSDSDFGGLLDITKSTGGFATWIVGNRTKDLLGADAVTAARLDRAVAKHNVYGARPKYYNRHVSNASSRVRMRQSVQQLPEAYAKIQAVRRKLGYPDVGREALPSRRQLLRQRTMTTMIRHLRRLSSQMTTTTRPQPRLLLRRLPRRQRRRQRQRQELRQNFVLSCGKKPSSRGFFFVRFRC